MIPAYKKSRSVLVVGGGIAGIQASLNLADMGYYVYLVDKGPAIGGTMPALNKTFPTNDCSMCILSPKLVECGRHPSITVLTCAEVTGISGGPGDFKAAVKVHPRGVDLSKCKGCGECIEECPVHVDSEFNYGLDGRKAIFKPYPQAYPNAYALDRENCIACEGCSTICPSGAVDRNAHETLLDIEVGAVIFCPGFVPVAVAADASYRYGGLYPGVLTALEFERLSSASGPYQGRKLVRPSDEKEIRKVAWIQCAGSRQAAKNRGYCSAVCCMYAVKQAVVAREQNAGELDAVIFYTDMRAFGKGFEKYYRRAEAEGVRFVRARVSDIKGSGSSGSPVRIKYMEEGGTVTVEEFDLAVLSMGIAPPQMGELPEEAGISLNSFGFCKTLPYSGVETTRPGLFVAGAFAGPKDIPDTVMQAGAAAAAAGAVLGPPHRREREVLPERDISGEEPRIGIVVCCCGGNIGRTVKLSQVVQQVSGLPNVAWCDQVTYACSQDNLARMESIIQEYGLNRVVVAACSPRTHRSLFQDIMQENGLNRYLVEMANIRDQCSWVHQHDRDAATKKATDLVGMAVARTARLTPLRENVVKVIPACLVVGGGVAGMSAAMALARQGFQVHLVEREKELGGNALRLLWGLSGENVRYFLRDLVEQVKGHPHIEVHNGQTVEAVEGYVGNFTSTLTGGEKIKHGTVIIATGAREEKPDGFHYGRHPGVKTLLELEEEMTAFAEGLRIGGTVVFIQCAGSRDAKRPYCSRVCCSKAVRLALILRETRPDVNVFVLYRDMATYGFFEGYYQEAREEGIVFIRHPEGNPPVVEAAAGGEPGGLLQVTVDDAVVKMKISIEADLVALAAPIVPRADNGKLSRFFKVPLNEEGFFLEAHLKLAPVDTASSGVYICGHAHGPKNIEESVIQARAAAARAASVLSNKELRASGMVASVVPQKCAACLTCVRLCAFGAPKINENRQAQIEPLLCRGCGVCAAECPNKAIRLAGYSDDIFMDMSAYLGS